MAIPETISVRFTEEDATHLDVRPVRRQTFRFDQLVDMVLSVTGNDAARVQQILRSGTVVYHFYRYWWPGLEIPAAELGAVLARFPAADPTRVFRAEECAAILLESADSRSREPIELERGALDRRKLFGGRSAWRILLDAASAGAPKYRGYSYSRRADLFELALPPEQAAALIAKAARMTPRDVRAMLERHSTIARIVYVCPRAR